MALYLKVTSVDESCSRQQGGIVILLLQRGGRRRCRPSFLAGKAHRRVTCAFLNRQKYCQRQIRRLLLNICRLPNARLASILGHEAKQASCSPTFAEKNTSRKKKKLKAVKGPT